MITSSLPLKKKIKKRAVFFLDTKVYINKQNVIKLKWYQMNFLTPHIISVNKESNLYWGWNVGLQTLVINQIGKHSSQRHRLLQIYSFHFQLEIKKLLFENTKNFKPIYLSFNNYVSK